MGALTVTAPLTLTRNPNPLSLSKFRPKLAGSRFRIRAYMERNPNSIASIAGKVIGSLPVIGLLARILSDEGGVGGDVIDFAEFRRRVGKKCGVTDSRAFYEFQDRRGRAGDPLYVLLCCWLAAVGAGLLKSEEILEGVARLRISNDIEFEEENFLSMMAAARERFACLDVDQLMEDQYKFKKIGNWKENWMLGKAEQQERLLSIYQEALQHPFFRIQSQPRRAKLKSELPEIPMEVRAEKALEAIYICCFGRNPVEEEDARLLSVMLTAVFPSIGKSGIEKIVNKMAKEVASGERMNYPEPKTLSKEAVQRQMKDLQFLQQNTSEN